MLRRIDRAHPANPTFCPLQAILGILALLGSGVGIALARRASHPVGVHPSLPPVVGFRMDRALLSVPLLDENGKAVSLASFRGKIVVLSPFLTLCHEVCPITTGAFLQMESDVAAAGLSNRVVFVEMTVDPWRDTPARLRAFARLTQVHFPFLTGTRANIRRIWDFFGIGYERVPQGAHPDIDWWTHKPETYDVAHVDGLFFIDPAGHERIFIEGMPDLHGQLGARLMSLLSPTGLANLRHPSGAWTQPQALGDLERMLGRTIPHQGT